MSNPVDGRAPMRWFRMYAEFATDPKVQMLSEQDQRRFLMLLCLRCSNGDVTLHETEIAFQLRITSDEWAATKAVLVERNLISQDNKPTAWESRQYASDSSAARVRKHREALKLSQKRKCNVTVTPPETETETETEIKATSPTGLVVIASDDPQPKSKVKKAESCPYGAIVDLYHERLPMLPRVEKLTETRRGYIRQRWSEDLPTLEAWGNYFADVARSEFLTGQTQGRDGKPPFRATLEWLTRPGNFAKVAEGNYHQ